MKADEEFFAAIWNNLGRSMPQSSIKTSIFTAAVISKPKLVIASVWPDDCGGAILDVSRSKIFELGCRSSSAAQRLARETRAFVTATEIDRIYLRSMSADGKYAGHPFNFKIEAILQMDPHLDVEFVHTNSVSAWVRQNGAVNIADGQNLCARDAGLQVKAIETALFVSATNWRHSSSGKQLEDD